MVIKNTKSKGFAQRWDPAQKLSKPLTCDHVANDVRIIWLWNMVNQGFYILRSLQKNIKPICHCQKGVINRFHYVTSLVRELIVVVFKDLLGCFDLYSN